LVWKVETQRHYNHKETGGYKYKELLREIKIEKINPERIKEWKPN
jgi:hypothetical protein